MIDLLQHAGYQRRGHLALLVPFLYAMGCGSGAGLHKSDGGPDDVAIADARVDAAGDRMVADAIDVAADAIDVAADVGHLADRPADVVDAIDGALDVGDAADRSADVPDAIDVATDVGDVADSAADKARDAPAGRCVARKPPGALISDFSSHTGLTFGRAGHDVVVGGLATTDLLQTDFSNGDWRTFGPSQSDRDEMLELVWDCEDIPALCPLNASDYAGIQFTIKSNAGPLQMLDFVARRIDDDTPETTIECGTCVEAPGTLFPTACKPPVATFAVTSQPTVVTLRWADFSGGLPNAAADPSQITDLYWVIHPPFPAAAPTQSYDIDVTIDDIQFVPF